MNNPQLERTFEVTLKALRVMMADNGVDRVTVSDHMILVKVGYDAFVEMFGERTDFQRLGSEIRCERDGVTYSADVTAGVVKEVKE